MMSIWKVDLTLEKIKERNHRSMIPHLGIEFIEIGEDFLRAKMPVDERTRQPYGILHGGASCTLAETAASVAANYCVDSEKFYCVGLEINTSHVRSITNGWIIATATPLHLGRSTQLWEIPIKNESGQLISMNRLRLAVLDQR